MTEIIVAIANCPGCGAERTLGVGKFHCRATCHKCETKYRFIEDPAQCSDCEDPDRIDCLALPTVFIDTAQIKVWTLDGNYKLK